MSERVETVTKLDAAKRQIEEAVEIFFRRGDMVAVLTLAAASLEILRDLGRPKGLGSMFKDSSLIRPEKQKEVKEIFGAAQNFFKHADRDPDASLEFHPDATPFFIFDAVELYGVLTGTVLPGGHVFRMWFVLKYPQFTLEPLRSKIAEARRVGIDPDDFETVRLALRQWKARNAVA